jgi:FixJ family two-component response regulator
MTHEKISIVVVDDDDGMNQAIRRLLSAAGFRALTFASAEALLEAGTAAQAACLVLDIHLPGLSGFELHRRLIQNGIGLPVVFITAYDDPDSLQQARTAGAIAYLTKPFSGQSLLTAIAGAVQPGGFQSESACR